MTLAQRLGHYEKLMRLDKPIGILLLLWPTLWGLWLAADGVPSMMVLAIFVAGHGADALRRLRRERLCRPRFRRAC